MIFRNFFFLFVGEDRDYGPQTLTPALLTVDFLCYLLLVRKWLHSMDLLTLSLEIMSDLIFS